MADVTTLDEIYRPPIELKGSFLDGRTKYDLSDRKFGKLTVVRRDYGHKHGTWWACECECGGTRIVRSDKLVNGMITSCERCSPRFKDMAGKRFGRLTVIEYAGPNHRKDATWLCHCDCGAEKVIQGQALRSGAVVSCGCFMRESKSTHRGTRDRLYGIWRGMRSRCGNRNDKSYKYYGAKGVRVCDEWQEDYAAFREWAMANGYDPEAEFQECTIDRIDPCGDYEPSNCRWVDIGTQERNRRSAHVGQDNDGADVLAAHAHTA